MRIFDPMQESTPSPYLISTPRLGLRRWIPADLEPFANMNQDPAVMRFFPALSTREESTALVKRIDAFFDEHGYGLYALELKATGGFIGFTGLSQPSFESWFTPCTEIGWRLRQQAWNKGYATEAAKACLDHARNQLRLKEVYSFTAIPNSPSERVMQKIGMTRIGEFDHPKIEAGHPLRRHVLYKIALLG